MTNRDKAFHWCIEARLYKTEAARQGVVDNIESALNDARKAGEIEGQIKALEWVRREGDDWQPFTRDTIAAELDRLRAEKAKLG